MTKFIGLKSAALGRGWAEGEGKVTDQPTESRFVVRKDARGKWMIWDRSARRPATSLSRGVDTTGLSEEEARQILEQLRQAHREG